MTDNRNTILAVILSGLVLIAWQYFYNVPQMEKQRVADPEAGRARQAFAAGDAGPRRHHARQPAPDAAAGTTPPTQPAAAAAAVVSRDAAIAATPRIKIDTPRVTGSISLKGARIDDVALVQYRETVDPKSPAIVLFSPSQTAQPLLCRIRLGAGGRLDAAAARPEHDVAAGRLRRAVADRAR